MSLVCIVANIVYCCTKGGSSGKVESANNDGLQIEDNRAQSGELAKGFTKYRERLGDRQRCCMVAFAVMLLVSIALAGAVFGIWSVKDYTVWGRAKRDAEVEFIPQSLAKGLNAVYVFEGLATKLKMDNIFFDVTTQFCGSHYITALTSDAEKKEAIYDAFIDKYKIDMTQFIVQDYKAFNNVNEWFIRKIRPEVRPIAGPGDHDVIVSPADARLNVFTVFADTEIWLKTDMFNIATLLGEDHAPFIGGSMAIVRLAPQDYHRFHMPISGTITKITKKTGTYHSVGVDGMRSDNDAIYNQRTVMLFDGEPGSKITKMAYVAVGATCVGSVSVNETLNTHYNKGEELGYFQFGGSTVVLVFPPNIVAWNDDLIQHSKRAVESLVEVGVSIARAK
jgi:phosphatidylserine decarboxylase precursor